MRDSKIRSKLKNVSALARKIYDVVPIADFWSIQQVRQEMLRLHSTAPDPSQLEGNLKRMVEMGVLRMDARGFFTRIAGSVATPQSSPAPTAQLVNSAPTAINLKSRFAEVMEAAFELSELIEKLESDVQNEIKTAHSEADKMQQLKALLGA